MDAAASFGEEQRDEAGNGHGDLGNRGGLPAAGDQVVASRFCVCPGSACDGRCRGRGLRPGTQAGECHPFTREMGVESGFPDRRRAIAGSTTICAPRVCPVGSQPGTGLGVAGGPAGTPQQQRACVVLHYYGGYNTAEISRMVGSTPAAVRMHLTRGRRRLQQLLEGGEGDARFATAIRGS